MAFHHSHILASAKAKRWLMQTVTPPMSAFCTIYLVALITREFLPVSQSPVLAASMGASAVILFINPNSQYSSPWSLIGGHLVSSLVGISCAISIPDTVLSAAAAVGGSMLIMQLLRCMNPPGAATALAPLMSPTHADSLHYYLLLSTVMVNAILLVLLSAFINRLLRLIG
ncbi:hypothetical protein MCAMS1_01022 [biofilm metagenome]